MKHQRTAGGARESHRDIDARLPTLQEELALRDPVEDAQIEPVAPGNTGLDQDGNWRIRIDNLLVEIRDSGPWVEQASWTV